MRLCLNKIKIKVKKLKTNQLIQCLKQIEDILFGNWLLTLKRIWGIVHNMNAKELEIFILNEFSKDSSVSQRKLAEKFEVSVGKINFVIKELSKKGYIKIKRFAKSKNKMKYSYILTPKGIEIKMKIAKEFIKRKIMEYERLLEEIED